MPEQSCAPILSVDDDPQIRRIIERSLKAEGYQIASASSAESALELLRRSGPYSLILLDVVMTGENGFMLAQRIRQGQAGEIHRRVPILFVTAEDDQKSFESSFEVGAIGYITKPFDPEKLVESVMGMLHG